MNERVILIPHLTVYDLNEVNSGIDYQMIPLNHLTKRLRHFLICDSLRSY